MEERAKAIRAARVMTRPPTLLPRPMNSTGLAGGQCLDCGSHILWALPDGALCAACGRVKAR